MRVIRSRYLRYSPSHSKAWTLLFCTCAQFPRVRQDPTLAHAVRAGTLYSRHVPAKCSTVSAWDLKLRKPQTWDLRGFVTEIRGAPSFPNVKTTVVSFAARARTSKYRPPAYSWKPRALAEKEGSRLRMRRRISEVPRPNPARISNALRIHERITDESIAKATEHLKVQPIPFWKAKYKFYHLSERT